MSTSIKILPNNFNEKVVAFFQCIDSNFMEVIVADFRTKKLVSINKFTSDDIKKFIDDIPTLFNEKFQAIVLNVFAFKANGYKHNLEFCQDVRDKFASIHIPTYFISLPEYMSSCFFIATNSAVELGENVLYLLENGKEISIMECKYSESGYDKELIETIEFDANADASAIRDKIIRSSNPKKIIFATVQPKSQKTQFLKYQILKNYEVEVFDFRRLRAYDVLFAVEMSKWLLDKTYTKYYFQPKCARRYAACYLTFEKEIPTPHKIFSVSSDASLPLEKTTFVSKSCNENKLYLVCLDPLSMERTVLQELDLIKESHMIDLILNVDSESFPVLKVEPYLIPKLCSMPEVFNKTKKSPKIPFIGIYGSGNYSVICYCKNEESGYEFLETWNGVYGKDLGIAFHRKKPVFGLATEEISKSNFGSAIFDIIKIMSMPPNNIKVEEYWYFKITKDENNPVLLDFNTFDGTRKAASPAFLMAMLIRQHLKAIEAEIGKKPTEIGFCFFDKYNKDEEKRIEKQLEESCTLLKLQSFCMFV